MEQKFIQANISVLLYLIVLYYLKNAVISFVEFPKKMFEYVKVYYFFLMFITVLGFIKRIAMLIRIMLAQWTQELLSFFFLGRGSIRTYNNKDILCEKRSKSLSRWKFLQESICLKKESSIQDSIEQKIVEWKKLVEQTQRRKRSDLQKPRIRESRINNIRTSDTVLYKREENDNVEQKNQKVVVETDDLKGSDNIKEVKDVEKTKNEKEREEKKEHIIGEERMLNEQNIAGIINTRKTINEKLVGFLSDDVTTKKKASHTLNDKLEDEIRNDKNDSTHENNGDGAVDANILHKIKEEVKRRSICLENCSSSNCSCPFRYTTMSLSNRSASISEEIEDIVKKGKQILETESLTDEKVQNESESEKKSSDTSYVESSTTNKECMDELYNIKVRNNKNEKIESTANLNKPLKSILKKNTLNIGNNSSTSEIRNEKEQKSKKCIRFNDDVETYYFEKSNSDEYLFAHDSKQMLWNIYGSYKISSADFFDYFNIRSNLKLAITDFLNPIHAYKNKLIKRF